MTGRIPLDLLFVGARIRGADPKKVAALAESVRDVGMLTPITVCAGKIRPRANEIDGYRLVAGLHRVEVAKALGWSDIPAHVVELDEVHRQLAECDENLCGTNLSPTERATFTMLRKQFYEALHPETRHGGDRKTEASRQVGDLNRFTADTAAKTGKSERVIQRDAERGERLTPEAAAVIQGTELDKGAVLDRVVKADGPEAQLAVVEQVRAERAPKSGATAATKADAAIPVNVKLSVDTFNGAREIAESIGISVAEWCSRLINAALLIRAEEANTALAVLMPA